MKIRLLLIIFLLIALPIAVSAQATVQNNSTEKPDLRLDQKVTYQAKGEFLYKVLEELSEKTGVTMACGVNKKDWQVRETKVSIFIHDMPLKDFQRTIASLLHYTWSKNTKDGVIYYRLYQTLRSKQKEDVLRAAAKEAILKKRIEMRKKALDELERIVALSPEEVGKLQEDSPFQYVLAKDPIGKAMVKLLQAVPEARIALLERREISIPVSTLSPEAKEAVMAFKQAYKDHKILISRSSLLEERFQKLEKDEDGQLLITNPMYDDDDTQNTELAYISFSYAEMPLPNFDNPFTKIRGKNLADIYGGVPIRDDERENLKQEARQLLEKAADKSPEYLDAFISDPDDPDLLKTIKLDVSKCEGTSDLLEEIAGKTELQIISDHFDDNLEGYPLLKPEDNVVSLLKKTALAFDKRAKKTGSVVVMEDRNWFEKRAWVVPEECMGKWRKTAKENNLQLDDIINMACLTDEQIDHTLCKDSILDYCAWDVKDNLHVLRLYAVLTDLQKTALFTEEGLDSASLNSRQWAFFEYMVSQSFGYRVKESDVDVYDSSGRPRQVWLRLEIDVKARSYIFQLIERNPNAGREGEDDFNVVCEWCVDLPALEHMPLDGEPTTDTVRQSSQYP